MNTDDDDAAAPAACRQALVELAVECWRFARGLSHTLTRLDDAARRRAEGQLRWLERSAAAALERAGLRLVDLAAQPFDAGMPATPLNLDDFSPDDPLVVDYMLEPVVMGAAGLVRAGTVMLRKDAP
jgi:hypothetical protein